MRPREWDRRVSDDHRSEDEPALSPRIVQHLSLRRLRTYRDRPEADNSDVVDVARQARSLAGRIGKQLVADAEQVAIQLLGQEANRRAVSADRETLRPVMRGVPFSERRRSRPGRQFFAERKNDLLSATRVLL